VDDRAFPSRLSASDSLMWRIESDPVLRSPILVVGLLDRSPPPDRLEAAVEHAAAALPRLRQRIVPPPLAVGRPRWEDAGEPSLAHHVRRVRAAGDDLDSVLEVAQPDAVAAFDPARPPWALTIVDGLAGGRAAFVLRFHHAITDGVGGI
jgi:diacylglycerol O-acyltransferase